MIKDLGEQDMTEQGFNAVLAFLAFISLLFESYFFPLRKIYRILKKKREMIKKAENK